jgi:LTXXQ motif family protein
MSKSVAGAFTALLVVGSSLANAQTTGIQDRPSQSMGVQDRPRLSQADLKALTDARVGLVKAALQLSPEQEKYWPALEEAIRTRSTGRQQRLAALADRLNQQRDVEPLELLRERANNLAKRSAELKKLVDAWQPLWQTLNPDQKQRLVILATHVLRVVRDAAEARQMEMYEDDGDQD